MRNLNAELKEYIKNRIALGETPEAIEANYGAVFAAFMKSASAYGEPPEDYLRFLYEKRELAAFVEANIANLPEGCLDVYLTGDVKELIPLLKNPAARKPVLEILLRGERQELDEEIVAMAKDFDAEELETAGEIIKTDEKARKKLLELAQESGAKERAAYIDLLMAFENKEGVFELIRKNFHEDVVLYALYLGRIEEDARRIVAFLQEKLKENVNYLEFSEIRNSIERLGGYVESAPDFENDYYYQLIKGKLPQ